MDEDYFFVEGSLGPQILSRVYRAQKAITPYPGEVDLRKVNFSS